MRRKRIGRSHGSSDSETYEVFVTSGGKCGSTAMYRSFQKVASSFFCHNTHYLKNFVLRGYRYDLMHFVNSHSTRAKPLIVNANREPLSRIASAFFQNAPVDGHSLPIPALVRKFKATKLFVVEQYSGADEWKQDGLDVYKYPFDHRKGYQLIEHKGKTYLNLLYERIHEWERIIQQTTRFKTFKLHKVNCTEHKTSGEIYRKFLAHLTPTHAELDKLYNMPFWKQYLNFYYTPGQIAQFRQKWTQRE